MSILMITSGSFRCIKVLIENWEDLPAMRGTISNVVVWIKYLSTSNWFHGTLLFILFVVYYKTIKRGLNQRLMYECRCDERLKAKTERSTRLTYTVLHRGQRGQQFDQPPSRESSCHPSGRFKCRSGPRAYQSETSFSRKPRAVAPSGPVH
jgi:hypothetical protein